MSAAEVIPPKPVDKVAVLTLAQVAPYFDISTRTANDWVARGKFPLPVHTYGGARYLVRHADLDKYLTGEDVPTQAEANARQATAS